MFHGTLNDMKETLIPISLHIQMTIYAYHASVTIKVSNLQNFHFLSLLFYFNLIS